MTEISKASCWNFLISVNKYAVNYFTGNVAGRFVIFKAFIFHCEFVGQIQLWQAASERQLRERYMSVETEEDDRSKDNMPPMLYITELCPSGTGIGNPSGSGTNPVALNQYPFI